MAEEPESASQDQPRAAEAGVRWMLRDRLLAAFADCDPDMTRAVLREASAALPLARVLTEVIHPALEAMGTLWEQREVTLTQIFLAGAATEDATAELGEELPPPPETAPTVVLGTLLDSHHLGARLVGVFLRAAGLRVVDLGAGLSPEELATRAAEENAPVVAVSTFLLRSAYRVPAVREELAHRGLQAAIAVGGAPFRADPGLAARVGADLWAPDAAQAARLIDLLCTKRFPRP